MGLKTIIPDEATSQIIREKFFLKCLKQKKKPIELNVILLENNHLGHITAKKRIQRNLSIFSSTATTTRVKEI